MITVINMTDDDDVEDGAFTTVFISRSLVPQKK